MTTPVDPAEAARALRAVALHNPLTLGMWAQPRAFVRRAHLELIAAEFRMLTERPGGRLLILTPPQCGKSQTAATFGPAWYLLKNPSARIAVGTYADALANHRGRDVRDLIREHGPRFGVSIARGSGSVADWRTTHGGGLRAVGVGSALTGFPADCLSEGTPIVTPQGTVPIEAFARPGAPREVLAFDHDAGRTVWRPVVAAREIKGRRVLEVLTTSGRTFRCTADHRIHVPGRGYTPAGDLRTGDALTVATPDVRPVREDVHAATVRAEEGRAARTGAPVLLPLLRHAQPERPPAMPDLRGASTGGADLLRHEVPPGLRSDHSLLRSLRAGLHPGSLRAREEGQAGRDGDLLLAVVRRPALQPEAHPVPRLRGGLQRKDGAQVLLRGVQDEGSRQPQEAPQRFVPGVRDDVPAQVIASHLLQPRLRESGALESDGRGGQLPVQGRDQLRGMVPRHAPAGHRARRAGLRGLPGAGVVHRVRPQGQGLPEVDVHRPPHQRGPQGQPAAEPRDAVQDVPRGAPQVDRDAVALVRPVRGDQHRVYDLQVAGTRNFFAGQVLVHNCLLVDDPVKDRVQADSKTWRDKVFNWWSAVATSRLAPGAPACVIQTPWHDDDLAGRLQKREGLIEEGGRWRVVRLPAFAEAADPLGRAPGEPLPHPKIPPGDHQTAAAHWEEKRRGSTARDWSSLYMCDPRPLEGSLVDGDTMAARTFSYGTTLPAGLRVGVAVDPSGGGRDVAGIIGGYLGDDGRVYLTHDRSGVCRSEEWARRACMLAAETDADFITVEKNFGGDMCRLAINSAWHALSREGRIPRGRQAPYIAEVTARRGKYLRAEPVAQQIIEDRVRVAGHLPEVAHEWTSWQPTDSESPGRIDASVYLVLRLLPHVGPVAPGEPRP